MDAGVNDEPHRAQHLVRKRSETLIRIGVKPHFITERLGIERPAFDIGSVSAKAHEGGKLFIFLRDADLEMVPRCAFVQIKRCHPRGRAARQIISIEVKNSGTRAVGRALLIASACLIFLAEFFIGPDFKRGLGQIFELRSDDRIDRFADVIIALGQCLAAGHLEFRIMAQMIEKFG